MSAEREIEIFETNAFRKAFKKLSEAHKQLVEDEIDLIITNPERGKRKKGDLSYLWVHKFKLDNQLTLLGYSWNDRKLAIHLLNIAPHENFYREAKKRRKADKNVISKRVGFGVTKA